MELDKVFEDDVNTGDELPEVYEPEIESKGETEPTEEPEKETEEVELKKEDAPPASKITEVPLPALLDEREKRQEAQRTIANLQQQLDASKTESRVDPLEDFDAAFNQRADHLMQSVNSRFIDLSANFARSIHKDYDDMEAVFLQELEQNPSLVKEMESNANPAEFAYQYAKSKSELAEAGDIDSLKAKLREEIKAEMLEESGKSEETRNSVPESLSDARSSGGKQAKVQGGLTPLDSMF